MYGNDTAKLPPLVPARDRKLTKKWLWVPVLVLAAGLAGVGGYRYGSPILKQHQGLLSQVPGLEQSLTAVDQRVANAEEKLRDWAGDWEGMKERLAKLESSTRRARRQTQELIAQAQHRWQTELDQRSRSTDARLSALQVEQESEGARAAQLQGEVAVLRRQVREQDERLAALQEQTGQDRGRVESRLAGLDQQMQRGRRETDSLAAQVDRRRVDFEVNRNHSRELAPGISLGITKTNVAYRRFDGWLWLMPDRKTVWVRSQSAHRPVVFYSKEDSRPRELVITHVTKDAAVGYLLLPARPAAGTGLAETAQLAPEGVTR